jgi:hypothetical protein
MQRAYCNHDFDLFSSLFELHVTHARPYISVLESLNISTLSFGQLDEERLIPPDFEGPSEDFLQTNQFSALTTWQPIDINPLVHPRLAELNGFEEVNPGLENDLFEYAELEDAIEELPQIEDNTTNVHEGQRDFLTAKAWSLLIENQSEDLLPQTQCLLEIRSFIKSLDDEESQAKALNAFEGEDVQLWPSLIDDTFYIAHYDEAIMGLEVAQRLWTFVCNLEEEKEIINAKYAFVSALKASIENGYRVCNPGKLQRLIVAVLSGRLKGADIDGGTSVSKEMAVGMFFSIESNQSIDDKETLIDSAEAFLSQNPLIDRSTFLEEINRFVDYSF